MGGRNSKKVDNPNIIVTQVETPVSVQKVQLSPTGQIQIPEGHAYVVPTGKEKGFFTTLKMANKFYSNPSKFTINKGQPVSYQLNNNTYESIIRASNRITEQLGRGCSGCGK